MFYSQSPPKLLCHIGRNVSASSVNNNSLVFNRETIERSTSAVLQSIENLPMLPNEATKHQKLKCSYSTTSKGKDVLIDEDYYEYTLQRKDERLNTWYWECRVKRQEHCKGRAMTQGKA